MTAVEWLKEQLVQLYNEKDFVHPIRMLEFIEQAKILEQEQMKISFPSDEEEEKAAFFMTKNIQQHIGFNICAGWMREQIKGGNK